MNPKGGIEKEIVTLTVKLTAKKELFGKKKDAVKNSKTECENEN